MNGMTSRFFCLLCDASQPLICCEGMAELVHEAEQRMPSIAL